MAPALVSLLGLVHRWCRVVATTADMHEPLDALLACNPRLLASTAVPTAVWVDELSDLDQALGVDVVLSDRAEVVTAAGRGALLIPGSPPRPAVNWVPPAVRERLRLARNLPEHFVIERDGDAWVTLTGRRIGFDLSDTALASASVAIVTGDAVVDALAWGTPTVTDRASAVAAGACEEVVVAETVSDRRHRAAVLAHDRRCCAQLSWTGRALYERCHAPELTAGALVRRLGLGTGGWVQGPAPLAGAMTELHTPSRAVVVGRAVMATVALSVPTD